ncbi:hypothetical protein NX774_17030 [Massilia agilis]|uniref:Uncharacterized protein n=1 Tax=Massilia agilis TaxID=1811226 RepID=A0ABT2DGT2_9BURK|nr:hypothetical protein [Massilia agilis]MCS0809628.1 hypothetical protein [Massilia agilis]
MQQVDWLGHFLQLITVTGRLEVRCAYGALHACASAGQTCSGLKVPGQQS